jgi:hypothetical protein
MIMEKVVVEIVTHFKVMSLDMSGGTEKINRKAEIQTKNKI